MFWWTKEVHDDIKSSSGTAIRSGCNNYSADNLVRTVQGIYAKKLHGYYSIGVCGERTDRPLSNLAQK